MRYPKRHKERTRARILECAARLFTARGYEATSIEDLMRGCGLTRGAFYAHFSSKGALYREALAAGAVAGDATGRVGDDFWIEAALREDAPGLAFLAADLASDEPEVRAAFGRVLSSLSGRLASRPGRAPGEEGPALSALAMVVGAQALAQATDDAELRTKLLAACRENARALLGRAGPPPSYFWEPPASAPRAVPRG